MSEMTTSSMDNASASNNSLITTYQWIILSRVLSSYGFNLSNEGKSTLMRNQHSWIYCCLAPELDLFVVDLILDQVQAYRIYLDKLLAEYLISGLANEEKKEEGDAEAEVSVSGQSSKALIEEVRLKALERSEHLHQWVETLRQTKDLIREELKNRVSQFKNELRVAAEAWFKAQPEPMTFESSIWLDVWADAQNFQVSPAALTHLASLLDQNMNDNQKQSLIQIYASLESSIKAIEEVSEKFHQQVEQLRYEINSYRSDYYESIVELQKNLMALPGFKFNEVLNAEARGQLHFDSQLGAFEPDQNNSQNNSQS